MQQILVYSDSLTWGIIPNTRRRPAFEDRWPSVMEVAMREAGMPVPQILIVVPPVIQAPRGTIARPFEGADEKSVGLASAYEEVARDRGCEFFDAGRVTTTSAVDGVHLDADQHGKLGLALAKVSATLMDIG